jgi:hypothetical protein
MEGKHKRKISVICAVLICVFSGLIHAEPIKIKVTAETAAVRVNPDIESQIVILLSRGQVLDSDGKTDGWYRVSVFLKDKGLDVEGYIHSSLVTRVTDASPEKSLIAKEQPVEKKQVREINSIDFSDSGKRRWLELKLGGGASYILANDINEGNEGFDQIWRDELTSAGGEIQGEPAPFHIAYEFEGNIILYIFPNIGIGFGSGYIYGSQENDMLLTFSGSEETWITKPEIKTVPITAGLYFLIPLGGGSYFTLDAGAGLYKVDYSWYWKGGYHGYWMELDQDAEASGIGYHAGLGFEIKLAPHLGFFLEGRARYAEISGFEGTLRYKDSNGGSDIDEGKLYYWEEEVFGNKYTFVFVSEGDTPSFTGLGSTESVREAVVDLTGVTLQAGLKIRF